MKKLMSGKREKSRKHSGVVAGSVGSRFVTWAGHNRALSTSLVAVGIIALAVLVPVAIYRSIAATGTASYEAEAGTKTSLAIVGSDSNAAGGQYIQFTAASGGGGGGGTATPGGRDTTCALQGLTMAFCDSFNTAATTNKSTDREGDLNANYWGVSRVSAGDTGLGQRAAATLTTPCKGTQQVLPPQDTQVCNGRLYDAQNDNHGQVIWAAYPKQPFSYDGRTGTVVFDLSMDSEGAHAAWPEFWLTDQPVPAPNLAMTTQSNTPRNGIGIMFASDNCGDDTGIYDMEVVRNYIPTVISFHGGDVQGCIKRSHAGDANLNHIKITISQSTVTVYATDPGSTTYKQIGILNNANLTLPSNRGLVWMTDVHYNADKFNDQRDHAFAWDNFGFDGPLTYRDLTFDVPDQAPSHTTYQLPITVNVPNVHTIQTPSAAYVIFNWWPEEHAVPTVSVNGNTAISTPWPYSDDTDDTFVWRTIAVPVPLSQINMGGTNTVRLSTTSHSEAGNINILLVQGSPVPDH